LKELLFAVKYVAGSEIKECSKRKKITYVNFANVTIDCSYRTNAREIISPNSCGRKLAPPTSAPSTPGEDKNR